MPLEIILNGHSRVFTELDEQATVLEMISALDLTPDRIAIEQNGAIAPRKTWQTAIVQNRDRIELVHFVGGGSDGSSHTS